MKLSKTSLVYRSAAFQYSLFGRYNRAGYDDYVPNDLCTFVRHWFLKLFLFTFFASAAGALVMSILFFLTCIITMGYWDQNPGLFAFGLVVTTVVSGLALIGGAISGGCKLKDMYDESRWSSSKKRKEPGIIRSYLKAHKEKYCPTLEITE